MINCHFWIRVLSG
ncbi:hypothetical protein F383_20854 [Gossypium arboreum]|uniref:Uncharacterized protein n=1 Tax=Gossypium arboreum TaxID=29729 RepID=A0A0B0NRF2_GOSAR|nr:hypothetical protein F383_20854 [Gossypium arboreum]